MHTLALGTFVFTLKTLPLAELKRKRSFRHPTVDRVGARPASQYAGPGEDTITLTGVMPFQFSGGMVPVDTIAAIANSGESRVLVTGYGEVLGAFVIVDIDETHRAMYGDGMPRIVDYSLTLRRVDDPAEGA